MFTDQQIIDFIKAGESETTGIMADIPGPDILTQSLSAFANHEGGLILVGVDGQRGPVGCDKDRMMNLFKVSKRGLRGDISPVMYFQELNGVDIAVIKVPKSERMVFAGCGAFVRQGAFNVTMTPRALGEAFARNPDDRNVENLCGLLGCLTETIERLRGEVRAGRLRKKRPGALLAAFLAGGAFAGMVVWWVK